jgi:peptide/nickel transport system permease protein
VANRPAGPWRLAARRIRRDRGALAFGALLGLIVLACAAAPLWARHAAGTGPYESHLTDRVRLDGEPVDVVALDGVPIGPTWRGEFLLGADELGRDLLVRLLYGGRNSLLIAFAAAALTTLVGALLGMLAGYRGGRTDGLIGRGLDLLWSFPVLLLGLVLGTALTLGELRAGAVADGTGSKAVTVFVIGVISIPYLARPVRGRVQTLRGAGFIEAAEAQGAGPLRVAVRELLPNVSFTVLALFAVLVTNAIILESALSFLGAGVRPPEPSWGGMIRAGLDQVTLAPHLLLAPCLALTLTVLSVNVLGESVRQALDPQTAAGQRPPT